MCTTMENRFSYTAEGESLYDIFHKICLCCRNNISSRLHVATFSHDPKLNSKVFTTTKEIPVH